MKITNLTNHETPALKVRGLVGIQIAVGEHLLAPGASTDVSGPQLKDLQSSIQSFLEAGALHCGDKLPEGYVPVEKKREERKDETPAPAAASAVAPEEVLVEVPQDTRRRGR